MNVLAGVDEAGLGPILGPLVVAGVALSGPEGQSPWSLLRPQVCRHRYERSKLRVADSKKVHQGPHKLERLERTVLAFQAAHLGHVPTTVHELLESFAVDLGRLRRCPWYEDLELGLPLRADADEIDLHAHRLVRALDANGMRLLEIAVRPMDVEEFNGLIARTDNKSRTHFHVYSRVIADLLRVLPSGSHLLADRCGGLCHYLPSLRQAYPGKAIERLSEDEHSSSYRIRTRTGSVKITFATGGEERAFPTALSSCIAKYVREVMLHVLNLWFARRIPGLRPTAGYYTDGRRFLEDVAEIVQARGFPRSRLIRVR